MNPYAVTVDMSVFVANLEPYIISLIKRYAKDADEHEIDERKFVDAVDEFMRSNDFHYMISDAVQSKVEECVSDAISNVSLRIEVD